MGVFAPLQRRLMYFPTRLDARTEGRAMVGWLPLQARDGDRLGHLSVSEDPQVTMVVAHGNAGTAVQRKYYAELVPKKYEVLLLEYPGYGSRAGKPSERANVAAMLEAIDVAAARRRPVVLLGESLGSAVACLAAAERREQVAAVVLVTPLPRIAPVARHHFPILPTFLIDDRYEADTALSRFGGPAAFYVAGQDEVIPTKLGLAMAEAYAGPKHLELHEGASHTTIELSPFSERWQRIFAFLEGAIAPR